MLRRLSRRGPSPRRDSSASLRRPVGSSTIGPQPPGTVTTPATPNQHGTTPQISALSSTGGAPLELGGKTRIERAGHGDPCHVESAGLPRSSCRVAFGRCPGGVLRGGRTAYQDAQRGTGPSSSLQQPSALCLLNRSLPLCRAGFARPGSSSDWGVSPERAKRFHTGHGPRAIHRHRPRGEAQKCTDSAPTELRIGTAHASNTQVVYRRTRVYGARPS